MNKKVFLSFWQALLVIACLVLICLILFLAIEHLFPGGLKSNLFFNSGGLVFISIYLPFILWIAKKSNIRIIDYFALPNFKILLISVVIFMLARFVIFMPLAEPIDFFSALLNGKLRFIPSYKADSIFIWKYINIILIVPVIEEIFFRGLVLKQFLKQYSPTIAIVRGQ